MFVAEYCYRDLLVLPDDHGHGLFDWVNRGLDGLLAATPAAAAAHVYLLMYLTLLLSTVCDRSTPAA